MTRDTHDTHDTFCVKNARLKNKKNNYIIHEKIIGKIFGGFNYFLHLCIVNKDGNFAPPREKFFSPAGEVKKSFGQARITFGFDKEDGRREMADVRWKR